MPAIRLDLIGADRADDVSEDLDRAVCSRQLELEFDVGPNGLWGVGFDENPTVVDVARELREEGVDGLIIDADNDGLIIDADNEVCARRAAPLDSVDEAGGHGFLKIRSGHCFDPGGTGLRTPFRRSFIDRYGRLP